LLSFSIRACVCMTARTCSSPKIILQERLITAHLLIP
jgi:hypothetical protein